MKKVLFALLIALMAIPAFAGIKIINGSIDQINGQKQIPFVVNWDNAVYAKGGSLIDFLDKADRDKDWEEQSIYYLTRRVNAKIGEYGSRLVTDVDPQNAECYFKMDIMTISKGGDIEGKIYLINKNGQTTCVMTFKSDDSDDDDSIAFRDQFSNIGDNLGKLLKKHLKQLQK